MKENFEMTNEVLKHRKQKGNRPNKVRGLCKIIVGLLLFLLGCLLCHNSAKAILVTILSYVLWGAGILLFLGGVVDLFWEKTTKIRNFIVAFLLNLYKEKACSVNIFVDR